MKILKLLLLGKQFCTADVRELVRVPIRGDRLENLAITRVPFKVSATNRGK